MRIKRLDIEGFKVFEKADIHFSENQTTAFIGNNGSGKTSILEALRFGLSNILFSISGNTSPVILSSKNINSLHPFVPQL